MFPFHTWLPDAHVEAPTAGSVILAAVLLKMGTYGFLRFSLPLLPKASMDQKIVQILAILSIIGIIYGALVSLMQADWKKLIAYSSVSHLGFCTLGIFSMNPNGIAGSVLQQVNHGTLHRHALPRHRRHLRAPPHPRDQGIRRPRARHAQVRHHLRHRHAQLGRPAAAQRLRRRVHHHAGRLRGQPHLGRLRRHRRDPGRGVPLVALPAHHARPGDQRQKSDHSRHDHARNRPLRPLDRLVHLDRHLPQALLRHPAPARRRNRPARPPRLLRRSRAKRRRARHAANPAATPIQRATPIRAAPEQTVAAATNPEAPNERHEPVLHHSRSLLHHPGDHAGDVRLRHPHLRLLDLPRSPPAQVPPDLCRPRRDSSPASASIASRSG